MSPQPGEVGFCVRSCGHGLNLVFLFLKQFDYEALANRLFKLASRQSTPSQNRKRLYKVIQK